MWSLLILSSVCLCVTLSKDPVFSKCLHLSMCSNPNKTCGCEENEDTSCFSPQDLQSLGLEVPERLPDPISLMLQRWESAELTTQIARILLRDMLGIRVDLMDGWIMPASCSGFDACLESWFRPDYNLSECVWIRSLSYVGEHEWYAAGVQNLPLTWHMLKDATIASQFNQTGKSHFPWTAETTLTNLSSPDITVMGLNYVNNFKAELNVATFAGTELFVPPICEQEFDTCGVLWHGSALWGSGFISAQVIHNLGLRVMIRMVPVGFEDVVVEKLKSGPTLSYYWQPTMFFNRQIESSTMVPVSMPPVSVCSTDSLWLGKWACHMPSAPLNIHVNSRLVSGEAGKAGLLALKVFEKFEVNQEEMLGMIGMMSQKNLTAEKAACEFLQQKKVRVATWIPALNSTDVPPLGLLDGNFEVAMNQISFPLMVGMLCAAGFTQSFMLLFTAVLIFYRNSLTIQAISLAIELSVVAGAMVGMFSCYFLGTKFWYVRLFTQYVGLVLMTCPLVVHYRRLYRIISNRIQQKPQIGKATTLMEMAILFVFTFSVLVVCILLQSFTDIGGTYLHGESTADPIYWSLQTVSCVLLLLACYYSLRVRNAPRLFHHGKNTGFVVYNALTLNIFLIVTEVPHGMNLDTWFAIQVMLRIGIYFMSLCLHLLPRFSILRQELKTGVAPGLFTLNPKKPAVQIQSMEINQLASQASSPPPNMPAAQSPEGEEAYESRAQVRSVDDTFMLQSAIVSVQRDNDADLYEKKHKAAAPPESDDNMPKSEMEMNIKRPGEVVRDNSTSSPTSTSPMEGGPRYDSTISQSNPSHSHSPGVDMDMNGKGISQSNDTSSISEWGEVLHERH
eukprot:gb/GEZN01001501.1/.p1 GENE.gb/GEZN01001501.1/~~gb/GEZN01001501.1/.p1  ORF type:complete len:846 (-),score=68.83 gb/GEZN01001501.1/:347-2884(-)